MFIHAMLYLCVGAVLGYVDTRSPPRPEWSALYKVRGSMYYPAADVIDPFYAWYDGKNARFRIDYFDGMWKLFQFGATFNKSGSEYLIIPVTTEEFLNKPECASFQNIKNFILHSVLPDMSKSTYIGVDKDTNTTIWQRQQMNSEGEGHQLTMHVKYQQMLSGDVIPVPVRLDYKTYDLSPSDHIFVEFSDYDVSRIDPSVFDVNTTGVKCTEAKSPAHPFNPIMEYISPASVAEHYDNEFDRFKTKHGKQYASQEEHATRKSIFRKNLRFIQSWNRAGRSFSLAVNRLADRTDDELAVLRGRRYSGPAIHGLPFPYSKDDIIQKSDDLPSSFDWRIEGAVTLVKDQLACGSCWAFGAVGAMEGALFLHNGGHLKRLSEQALIDCSWGFNNIGCRGGLETYSFQWIMKHGLPTYDAYGGYLALDGYCHIDNMTEVTKIKGWVNVTPNNEDALKLAIFKHGPVSVGIDAGHRSFYFYSHGVYYEPKCKNQKEVLDHAVLAIGYGELSGTSYWLVKNSWSDTWGDQGYILMSTKDNNCGVTTDATYVTM